MTVIAYDGRYMAGDKMTADCGFGLTTTKVLRIGDLMVGGCGDSHRLREMHEWVCNGRMADDLPSFQRSTDSCVQLLVVNAAGQIMWYCNSHIPVVIEDSFAAIGSGRDFALAAMWLGKTAHQAVEVASRFCMNCGNGVDVLDRVAL